MRHYTLFILIIFYNCTAQKIDSKQSNILTGLKEYKLKGPVKEQRYTSSYLTGNTTNKYVDRWIRNKSEVGLDVEGYISFDRNGLVTTLREHSLDSLTQNIQNITHLNCYDYDVDDLKLKVKYGLAVKTNSMLIDDQLINLDQLIWSDCRKVSNETEDNGIISVYKYKFDELGRIQEEREYEPYHEDFKGAKIDDLYAKIDYKYNTKGNLIEKQIYPGKRDLGDYYFMDATMGLGSDLRILFEYDENYRLVKRTVKKDGKVYASETYSYNPEKSYVEKVKKYVYGISRFDSSDMTITYNEHGDMIQFEYDSPQNLLNTAKIRYYEYEYDKYNNWIKCIMYMETGKKDPVAIATRKIEYYNK